MFAGEYAVGHGQLYLRNQILLLEAKQSDSKSLGQHCTMFAGPGEDAAGCGEAIGGVAKGCRRPASRQRAGAQETNYNTVLHKNDCGCDILWYAMMNAQPSILADRAQMIHAHTSAVLGQQYHTHIIREISACVSFQIPCLCSPVNKVYQIWALATLGSTSPMASSLSA
eukprot:1161891-Pelagomonas_calceolata.AAC.1